MKTIWRIRAKRARGDRGTALVEAAFITPVLFFLMFSILEFGMAFRDYLAIANTSRDSAREASVVGNDASADFHILQTLSNASNVINRNDILKIVIFRATGPNSVVPPSCTTATVGIDGGSGAGAVKCNVYAPSAMNLAESEFGCRAGRNLDRYWCPTTRDVTVALPAADYVGVWIKVKHTWMTGLFGDSLTMTDSTVMRMEPQSQV